MADVEWIKITTDMFDNRKIKYLRKLPAGNDIVLIWVMLLTMAGRCNAGGMIFLTENIPYTAKTLADELGFEENTIRLAIDALKDLSMVRTDEFLTITGWAEYQNIEGMDKIREQNRLRKAKQREKEKLLLESHVTSRDSHGTEEDIEEELDIEIENKRKSKKEKFIPPTLEEVKAYVQERNSNVDPIKFWDYYETGGWKDSKGNPVKNWKQKLLTWEKKDGVKNDVKRNAPVSNDPNKFLKQDSFMKAIADLQKG